MIFPLAIFSFLFYSIFISNETNYIWAAPIMASILPVINLIITKSIISSIFLFYANLCQVAEVSNTIILVLLKDSQVEKMVILMIITTFFMSFTLICVIWYYLKSTKALIIKLEEQEKKLIDLNKKLEVTNLKLQETVNIKNNLFLSVSHEVRNPLNVIGGSADLAFFCSPSKQVKNHLDNIKESVELLTYLINNLLDTSKLNQEGLQICKSLIESWSLIRKIWRTTKILLIRKRIYGEMFISKNMPKIIAVDAIRIIQIIYNLVGNAVKFAPSGFVGLICSWIDTPNITSELIEPTNEDFFRCYLEEKTKEYRSNILDIESSIIIRDEKSFLTGRLRTINSEHSICDEPIPISTTKLFDYIPKSKKMISYSDFFSKYEKIDFETILENQEVKIPIAETKKGFLKIEIIDSGCGINPTDCANLCKKFTQVGSESNKRLGTGLGLWIVKNLCAKMDGDLVFSSIVDKGSVFIAIVKCV